MLPRAFEASGIHKPVPSAHFVSIGGVQELGWPAASVGPLGAGTVMLPYFGVVLAYAAGSRAQ